MTARKQPKRRSSRDADPEGPACASCGAAPTGTYRDGSPSYSCYDPETHRPIYPVAPPRPT